MKNKHKLFLSAIGTSLLLAGCFGEKEVAPLDTKQKETGEIATSAFEKKLELEGENLKIYIEEIQAQRFSAFNSFQAFFPAVYNVEIRTSEYKQAIENIVSQYQYVYNSAKQLTNSYPENQSLKDFFNTVKIESEEIVVPILKSYYDLNATELLQFGDSIQVMDYSLVEEFNGKLTESGNLLSTNEVVNANAAKQILFTEQRKVWAGVNLNTSVQNYPDGNTSTFGELNAEELLKQMSEAQAQPQNQ